MNYTRLTQFNQRRVFDPSKKEDLEELKHFLLTKSWKTVCPFYLEFPWESIPVMCLEKFAVQELSKT